MDFSMFDAGEGPESPVRARPPKDNVRPLPKKIQPHPLESDEHLGQHILYDPAQENALSGVTDPDGNVVLHHYSSSFNGNPHKVTFDPNRLGQNPWSKAEKRTSGTPKTFFYTNPADRESFTEGMSHYVSKVPASTIYDMTADPKKIVSRIAARGAFHIDKALAVLKRLGYKGVFYSGSFPTVAMMSPIVGRKLNEDTIPGGLADNKPASSFDSQALMDGIRVEMEHTKDARVAAEIARDHLTEDPQYYAKLKKLKLARWTRWNYLGPMGGSNAGAERGATMAGHKQGKRYHVAGGGGVFHAWDPGREHLGQFGTMEEAMWAAEQHKKKTRPVKDHPYFQGWAKPLDQARYLKSPSQYLASPVHDMFADWLEEQGDSRAQLVRGRKSTREVTKGMYPIASRVGHAFRDGTTLVVQPNQKSPEIPERFFHVAWDGPAKRWYNSVLSEPEFRSFLDNLPEQEREGAKLTFQNDRGTRIEDRPQQLSRRYGPLSFEHNGVTFYRSPEAVWTMYHQESGKSRTMQGLQFKEMLNRLPAHHSEPLRAKIASAAQKVRLARGGYGYCNECKAPYIKHDKKNKTVHCPNGHRKRYVGRPEKLKFSEEGTRGFQPLVDAMIDRAKAGGPEANKIVSGKPSRRGVLDARADEGVYHSQMSNAYDVLCTQLKMGHPLFPVAEALSKKHWNKFLDLRRDFNNYQKARYEGGALRNPENTKRHYDMAKTQLLKIAQRLGQPKKLSEAESSQAPWKTWIDGVPLAWAEDYVNRHAKRFRNHEVRHVDSEKRPGKRRIEGRRKKVKLAMRAPAGGMVVNNQFHQGGQILPRALKRISSVIAAYRRKRLKLSRPGEPESVLSPEDKKAGLRNQEDFDRQVSDSIHNRPGVLPTNEEIKSLAHVGESVKGQYQHAGKVLSSFIGQDNAKLFVAANAILSPLAKWEHHSRAAIRLLRLWREAGSPNDPGKIHELVERLNPALDNANGERTESGEKIYPSIGWGVKSAKLRELLSDPQRFMKRIEDVAKTKRGKIVDFGRAFFDPNGVPIDTHMSKLTHPGAEDVRSVFSGDRDSKAALRGLIKETKTPHLLTRALANSGTPELQSALLDAQKRLVSKDATYKAYKVAIAHAAQELGWEPRQVQETVWSAVVSIIAAKNTGVPTNAILQFLRHENAFQAWNVGGLLSTPEIQRDIRGLSKRPVESFVAAANRAPARSGNIDPGNASAFADVAARVPGVLKQGAWVPIEHSIRTDDRPPF